MGEVLSITRRTNQPLPAMEMIRWAFAEPERQAFRLGVLEEKLAMMRAFEEPEQIIRAFEDGSRSQLSVDAKAAADIRSTALQAGYVHSTGT